MTRTRLFNGSLGRSCQQRQELSRLVKRDQIVTAANVGITDEDLRHRAARGPFHHFG